MTLCWTSIKKYKKYYALGIILLIALFVRTYHFSELLIFQSDQSRDFLIIQEELKGNITDLPLQGPQARGSTLHLGPIFYYFQYVSASFFGGTIESLAYPDLLFGVVSVLLLFFLLRAVVSVEVALLVTLLSAVSYFLVSFSRFAWNPNSLSFFTALLSLSVITLYTQPRHKVWSVTLAALALGVIFQLHFIAALALLLTVLVWLFIYKPITIRYIVLAAAIVIVIQTPTFIQEVKNPGSVGQAFRDTVVEKNAKENSHSIIEKGFRSGQSLAANVLLVTTGQEYTQFILTRGLSIKCDSDCRDELPKGMLALIIFSSLVWTYGQSLKKAPLARREILVFFGIWFFCYYLVTTLVAYQISTRFYLGLTPVVFVSIALFLEQLRGRRKYLLGVVMICMLGGNLFSVHQYMRELEKSQYSSEESHRDLIFGTEEKVTLGQLRALARQIVKRVPSGAPVLITGESRYARSVYAILSYEYHFSNICYSTGDHSTEGALYQVEINKNKVQNNYLGTLTITVEPPQEESSFTVNHGNCL